MRNLLIAFATMSLWGCCQLPPVEVPPPTAAQTQAVILDIDGTLTPKNVEVFTAREDAAKAVNALADKGYRIVYITTRIPLFQASLPGWLKENGFPSGPLHIAQNADERADPTEFKHTILAEYLKRGWHLAFAYGDSKTDFDAYEQAAIPSTHVFALKREGCKECEPGEHAMCLTGWTEHVPYIEREVPSAK